MIATAVPFAGELAGLATAACWATCSLAFASASRRIGATIVNQLRMPVAIVVLGTVHWLAFGEIWPSAPTFEQVFWLAGIWDDAGELSQFHPVPTEIVTDLRETAESCEIVLRK